MAMMTMMIAFESMSYTSLRDLPPVSPPYVVSWPMTTRKDSWREIPIRDPLLQQAAWAYLQPMAPTPHDRDGHRWWRMLQDKLCGLLGGCFNGVMLTLLQCLLPKQGSTAEGLMPMDDDDDNGDDGDDDDDGDHYRVN